MKPTAAGIEKGKPRSDQRKHAADQSATARRRTRPTAMRRSPNIRNSIVKMIASATGTTKPSRLLARVKFSNCPPQSMVTPGVRTLRLDGRSRFLDEPDQIAAAHVDLDQDASLQRLAVDDRRTFRLPDVGHRRHRHELARRRADQQLAERLGSQAGRRQEQHQVEAARSLENLAGETPHPGRLDDLQHLTDADPVAGQTRPIGGRPRAAAGRARVERASRRGPGRP